MINRYQKTSYVNVLFGFILKALDYKRVWHCIHFSDIVYSQIGFPPVKLNQGIVVGAQIGWQGRTSDGTSEQTANSGTIQAPACVAKPMMRRVYWSNTTMTQCDFKISDSQRKRSTHQRLPLVCPSKVSQDSPSDPDLGL